MTLKDIIKFLQKEKAPILITGLVFAVVGVLAYFVVPQKYEATGTLFVARKIDEGPDFFTYEGYYASQSAQSYTPTVIGLLKSDAVKGEVLKDLSVMIDARALRELGRVIDAKKQAPQLIQVTVKNMGSVSPEVVWNSLVENTVTTSQALSSKSDPSLVVIRVNEEPIVRESFSSLYLNAAVGFLLGVIGAGLFLSAKEYFKNL
jgi:capsular polysaccharide biosynthesis protein